MASETIQPWMEAAVNDFFSMSPKYRTKECLVGRIAAHAPDMASLRQAILTAGKETCGCCALGGVYNGLGSGPTIFQCPKSCSCHD